jgi:NADH-quinone oxidoreductase subunit L
LSPEALIVVICVLAPLVGATVAGLFGRYIGHKGAQAVTTALLLVSAACAWVTFLGWRHGDIEPFTQVLLPFINVGDFQSAWSVRLDGLSAVMLIVVTTVSALVHVYSWGYMAEDDGRRASSATSRCSPSPC